MASLPRQHKLRLLRDVDAERRSLLRFDGAWGVMRWRNFCVVEEEKPSWGGKMGGTAALATGLDERGYDSPLSGAKAVM